MMKFLRLLVLGSIMPIVAAAQTDMLPLRLAHAPDTIKTWTLRQLGDSLVEVNKITTARQAYEQALTIAEATRNKNDIGLSTRSIGYWYEAQSNYNQAIAWYQKALTIFKETGHHHHYLRTLGLMSFAFIRMHDDKRAYEYAQKGIAFIRQNGPDNSILEFYSTLATYESHRKHFAQAIAYSQKILDYHRSKKSWGDYYGTLFNCGLYYKNMGEYGRSEQTFREVLAYADKNKNDFLGFYANMSIPYALIPQNKLDEAEKYCNLALAWIAKSDTPQYDALQDINEHLSRIWEKRGDYKQALFYYRRQVANHDSVFNEVKNRQFAELETRYQTSQKEEQIKVLDATNAQQTRQIWAGAGGLVMLSLLLGTMVWQYRRIGRSRTKIQQQSDQMALMMRELHHRVKNNLAIVSSLLKLQSNRLDDDKAVAAVRTGQQRVEAMSLIHQRLYQSDSVTTVNIQEYITDLADSLMQAYGYNPETFNLIIDVEPQELDVDVAMPLGLIANELITNAFKYAYTGEQEPMLRIGLHNQNGLKLEVQDNGPGVDEVDWQYSGNRASFGKRLIASLSAQLDGQFKLTKQNGTLFSLYIPLTRLRPA